MASESRPASMDLVLLGPRIGLGVFFLRAAMLGALFLMKIHTPTFIDQEWLAFWMSVALLGAGAGAISLDAYRRGGAQGPARRGSIAARGAAR